MKKIALKRSYLQFFLNFFFFFMNCQRNAAVEGHDMFLPPRLPKSYFSILS